jgi:lysophospholipase L1-like esterase
LLTTPGDFFIKGRYHCRDIEKVVEAIYELAREQDCAVWDFNRLMGGSYAIRQWQAAGLARNDLIHFSEKGYRLQGFLFYEALTDAYQHWRETH